MGECMLGERKWVSRGLDRESIEFECENKKGQRKQRRDKGKCAKKQVRAGERAWENV